MKDDQMPVIKEWLQKESLPADVIVSEGPLAKQMEIKHTNSGSVTAEFSSFNSFLITHLDFTLDESASCNYAGSGETMGLYFNLAGSCAFGDDNSAQHVIAAGQQNIFFSSTFDSRLSLYPDNGQFKNLEINFPVSYYTELLSGHSPLQDQFINQIHQQQQSFIQLGILPMTRSIKWIIHTIQQCKRTGVLKRLFLESKILELLMLQVEQAEKFTTRNHKLFSKSLPIESLHEARLVLERSLDAPPTIRNLARMVGMNEFDLKKGFKETFGHTIYGYVSKVKMEQARQMILDGDKAIAEVSAISGYRNPQHFTAAFKRYFGIIPSKIKAIFFLSYSLGEEILFAEELVTMAATL